MTAPRTELQRTVNALRGADLLLELIEKHLKEHVTDLAAVRVSIEQALDQLRRA
jgi:hypothetical protein